MCTFCLWGGVVTQRPKVNAALPPHAPADVWGLHGLLACECGRREGAVGGQGDAVALQPRSQPLLQKLPLQAQVQRPQGPQQEVQPETHQDTGVAVPAGGRDALGGRDTLPGPLGSRAARGCTQAPSPPRSPRRTCTPAPCSPRSWPPALSSKSSVRTATERRSRVGAAAWAHVPRGDLSRRGAAGGAETHPRPGPTHTASPPSRVNNRKGCPKGIRMTISLHQQMGG